MSVNNFNKLSALKIRIGKNEYFGVNPEIKNIGIETLLSKTKICYKKGILGSYMLWIFGLTIVLGLEACSGGQENDHDKSEKPKDEKEYHAPEYDLVFFSKKTGTLEKNVIKGFLQNISEHTTYSNILVMVEFYDKNNAFITREQLKLNESIKPSKTQKFKLEIDFPEGVKTYRMKLISADVLPQN
jgi:hypothetical protein